MAQKFDLKKFRQSMGLKQSELAAILGLPQSSISSMESGKTQVSQVYINRLVEKMGITNIEEFYYDASKSVSIHNEGNVGDNNGYSNYKNVVTPAPTDGILLTKMAVFERDLAELKEQLIKKDNRCDELQEEVMRLNRQLTAFQVLCARQGIDFEHILEIK